MTTTTAPAARPFPLTLEIHCTPDPAFTREFGSKVKAAGGSYTECRAGAWPAIAAAWALRSGNDAALEHARGHLSPTETDTPP